MSHWNKFWSDRSGEGGGLKFYLEKVKYVIPIKLLENMFPVVSGSGGSKDDPKEYQFWSTQPVPGLHEVLVIHYTTLIQAEPVLRII